MAQWNHSHRTLYAKLVYYGPALGGKTTNLQSLHRLSDPRLTTKLLSVQTADDRTLFFDLLPFDLGEILDYKVAVKLYTVPGQVRYDATRRVVLSGADAVVFVADSSRGREVENRGSLENLRVNLRANRLDPATVPVLFQFNKQDLPEAAKPAEVARWLGVDPALGFPAIATEGKGVLETFMAACRMMLHKLTALAARGSRRNLDLAELDHQLEQAFSRHLERMAAGSAPLAPAGATTAGAGAPIVVQGEEPADLSIRASLRLGEDLSAQMQRAARLEREVETLRTLSDALREVGAEFDREAIVDASLGSAGRVIQADAVTLLRGGGQGGPELERAWECDGDPLLASDEGKALAAKLVASVTPRVIDPLPSEIESPEALAALGGFRSVAAVPVEPEGRLTMLAYVRSAEVSFGQDDLRFLATVAGHLAAGLDKAHIHAELAAHRDRLEGAVRARTFALRRALRELSELDRMKDRFLSNLSHEMRTPLTGILGSATFLRDYEASPEERAQMLGSIVECSRALEKHLEDLFRVARLDNGTEPLQLSEVSAADLAAQAVERSGASIAEVAVADGMSAMTVDAERLVRALANLLDNARKFSPEGSPIELRIDPAHVKRGARVLEGVVFRVLDRGPGLDPDEEERLFGRFEQGGDPLTAKPKGIGLGLHEARRIARMHGGTLAWRQREGGGSEFHLTVPLRAVGAERAVEMAHA